MIRLVLTAILLLLPSVVNAATPRVSTGGVPGTVRAGESFDLPIDVLWEGQPSELAIVGVHLGTAPGLEFGSVSHTKTAKDGLVSHRISHTVTMTQPGEHTLGPMVVQYRDEAGQSLTFDAQTTVTISVLPAAGIKNRWLGWAGLFALGGGMWFWRSRRREKPIVEDKPAQPNLTERFEACQTYVSNGNFVLAYETLAKIKEDLPQDLDMLPPRKQLLDAADKIRYGGYAPDKYEAERWLRAAEVATRRVSDDPATGE